MRGLGVADEEASSALTDPVDQARVVGAFQQGFDAVQRIHGTAAIVVIRFRPLVDHRQREPEVGGDLFGAGSFQGGREEFVRLHGARFVNARPQFKAEGGARGYNHPGQL